MSDGTKIEWTEATWNPIRARNLQTGGVGHFCVHASPGCKHCYSEAFQPRFKNPVRFAAQDREKVEVFLDDKVLMQPLRWKKPRMIFVCSMTDLFGEFVSDAMLDRVFAVMALCPQHTFQVLAKRSGRMQAYISDPSVTFRIAMTDVNRRLQRHSVETLCRAWPLSSVWLGVSVEDQARADERIPDLLATPATVRWLSCEPLLGPVDLTMIHFENERGGMECYDALDLHLNEGEPLPEGECDATIDWVVVGGESGPSARPMHPDWARSLRDQCAAAGVPFFFKQWGNHRPTSDCEHGEYMMRATKQEAGRHLDGVLHDGFPEAHP